MAAPTRQGGFWIGTMGKKAELGAGAIYRYYKGELRKIYPDITIPNSICFCPQGDRVYFSDTPTGQIMTQASGHQGLAEGRHRGLRRPARRWAEPRRLCHRRRTATSGTRSGVRPASRPTARMASSCNPSAFPAQHTSCPAFGGPDLKTLFCTSARQDLTDDILAAHPENGQTFAHRDRRARLARTAGLPLTRQFHLAIPDPPAGRSQ